MDAVGTGALTFTSGVNLYKWLKPFLIYSNIWMNNPINIYKNTPDHTAVRSRDYVTFNLAAEYPIPNSKFVLLCEMYSNWTWNNLQDRPGLPDPADRHRHPAGDRVPGHGEIVHVGGRLLRPGGQKRG